MLQRFLATKHFSVCDVTLCGRLPPRGPSASHLLSSLIRAKVPDLEANVEVLADARELEHFAAVVEEDRGRSGTRVRMAIPSFSSLAAYVNVFGRDAPGVAMVSKLTNMLSVEQLAKATGRPVRVYVNLHTEADLLPYYVAHEAVQEVVVYDPMLLHLPWWGSERSVQLPALPPSREKLRLHLPATFSAVQALETAAAYGIPGVNACLGSDSQGCLNALEVYQAMADAGNVHEDVDLVRLMAVDLSTDYLRS